MMTRRTRPTMDRAERAEIRANRQADGVARFYARELKQEVMHGSSVWRMLAWITVLIAVVLIARMCL